MEAREAVHRLKRVKRQPTREPDAVENPDDSDPDRKIMRYLARKLGIKDKKSEKKTLSIEGLDFLFKGIQAASVPSATPSASPSPSPSPPAPAAPPPPLRAPPDSVPSTAPHAGVAAAAARAAPAGDPEARLVRFVRGQLNRLSESTVESIAKAVAALTADYAMADLVSVVGKEILAGACRVPRNPLIPVYAAFVPVLGAMTRSDASVVFTEQLALALHAALQAGPDDERMNDIRSLALLLAHLFLFEVIAAQLVLDVLRALLRPTISDDRIEVFLAVIQTVGTALRTEDPLGLKETIQFAQQQVGMGTASKRAEFMLETLRDLKHNKRKMVTETGAVPELIRTVRAVRQREGESRAPLKIALDDFLQADTRGRWWRVGAAWAGLAERPEHAVGAAAAAAAAAAGRGTVEALASAQRMTTPLRRDIFVAIMEAEDYVNAFERLMKLSLKSKQAREIIVVLFDCCAQEKAFNPFYGLLAVRLCEAERHFAFTAQLRFWDLMKEMADDAFPLRRIANLARLLAFLLQRFALSLAVLKGAPLETPRPRQAMFLRLVMVALLDVRDADTVQAVFGRLAATKELMLLRDALSIFLKQYMQVRSDTFPVPLDPEQRQRVAEHVRVAREALAAVV